MIASSSRNHWAALKGYDAIVVLLPESGDIAADNGGVMTPLMFTAMFGCVKVLAE